jgi:propionate CoA-transferase
MRSHAGPSGNDLGRSESPIGPRAGRRTKIIDLDEAVGLIVDGDTLAVGGFVGLGVPEALLVALAERFERTGGPRDLTLVFTAGQGDGSDRGLNRLAREGLIRRAIGAHWGLVPALGTLALDERIEAYCLPLGVMSHLYRETAARRPGLITRVGLGTFVDPRQDGGRMNGMSNEEVVRPLQLDGEEFLFYPCRPLHVAFLRGTTADAEGNVTMEREAATLDSLSIAQATRSSGGIVIVQVERVATRHVLPPRDVRIPGIFVDAVVIAPGGTSHLQTYAEPYNAAYVGDGCGEASAASPVRLDARAVIARRAAQQLGPGFVVNVGIGIPEGIVDVAAREGILETIKLTIEAGPIGGRPAGGLSFGAAADPEAIIDMPYQFDFYDAGLDQAFLGMAQVDRHGNVNVSRFGRRLAGAGGFIDISQAARNLVFMGTFSTGGEIAVEDGGVRIRRDGAVVKFVGDVDHVTFSAERARVNGQSVLYVTERCVFRLNPRGLELIEIAPGIDLERDVLARLSFQPEVAPDLREMDPSIFGETSLGLAARASLNPEARIEHRAEERLVLLTLRGLTIHVASEAESVVRALDRRLGELPGGENVIVDCGGFEPDRPGAIRFLELLRDGEWARSGSSAWYCPDAFLRRKLARLLAHANGPRIHATFRDAVEALSEYPVGFETPGAEPLAQMHDRRSAVDLTGVMTRSAAALREV